MGTCSKSSNELGCTDKILKNFLNACNPIQQLSSVNKTKVIWWVPGLLKLKSQPKQMLKVGKKGTEHVSDLNLAADFMKCRWVIKKKKSKKECSCSVYRPTLFIIIWNT